MNFQIGDKVVCVDDRNAYSGEYIRYSWPEAGNVYIVQGVDLDFKFRDGQRGALFLSGLFRIHVSDGKDTPFSMHRFRKLDELKAESRERYYATQTTPQP